MYANETNARRFIGSCRTIRVLVSRHLIESIRSTRPIRYKGCAGRLRDSTVAYLYIAPHCARLRGQLKTAGLGTRTRAAPEE